VRAHPLHRSFHHLAVGVVKACTLCKQVRSLHPLWGGGHGDGAVHLRQGVPGLAMMPACLNMQGRPLLRCCRERLRAWSNVSLTAKTVWLSLFQGAQSPPGRVDAPLITQQHILGDQLLVWRRLLAGVPGS